MSTKEEEEKRPKLNDGSESGKIFINLEYKYKNIGKVLGCKWDSITKKWYLPNITPEATITLLLNISIDEGDGQFRKLFKIPKYIITDEDEEEFDKKELAVHKMKYLKKETAIPLFGKYNAIKNTPIDYKSMFAKN